jgi:hypothetical protein
MDSLGTITFQANDSTDIFLKLQVQPQFGSTEPSDEDLMNVEDPQFHSNLNWVTGNVPKMTPVQIEGDTTVISAWFQARTFGFKFMITIYVECEFEEELIEVEADEIVEGEDTKADLEPQEIYL